MFRSLLLGAAALATMTNLAAAEQRGVICDFSLQSGRTVGYGIAVTQGVSSATEVLYHQNGNWQRSGGGETWHVTRAPDGGRFYQYAADQSYWIHVPNMPILRKDRDNAKTWGAVLYHSGHPISTGGACMAKVLHNSPTVSQDGSEVASSAPVPRQTYQPQSSGTLGDAYDNAQ